MVDDTWLTWPDEREGHHTVIPTQAVKSLDWTCLPSAGEQLDGEIIEQLTVDNINGSCCFLLTK